MVTSKQPVSAVLLLFLLILSVISVSILCLFDVSSVVFVVSEMYQLINRRNMIVLCHFILMFIVKDSGLLSPRRDELSAYKERAREFGAKEVQLETKEEIGGEKQIHTPLDVVVMEKREEITETNKAEELEEEEVMEVMEEIGYDDAEEEEEMEEEESGVLVEYYTGDGDGGEEEQEMEIEELNRKFEEFIKKFKQQMNEQQTVLA